MGQLPIDINSHRTADGRTDDGRLGGICQSRAPESNSELLEQVSPVESRSPRPTDRRMSRRPNRQHVLAERLLAPGGHASRTGNAENLCCELTDDKGQRVSIHPIGEAFVFSFQPDAQWLELETSTAAPQ